MTSILNNKEFHFFMDETGDHGLSFVDESFPIFLLAGCLFESAEYEKITQEINAFKQEFLIPPKLFSILEIFVSVTVLFKYSLT